MFNLVLVEDNEGLRMLLELKFKRLGWSCTAFENGMDAHTYLEKNTPDLLIIDLMIPGASGFEVLYHFPHIPAIILSAKAREEDIERGLTFSNVVDYVTKPFKISSLIRIIEKHT